MANIYECLIINLIRTLSERYIMLKLSRLQKIAILITIFWEIFAYNINYENFADKLNFTNFMFTSSPAIIYWSIVWIWGLTTILQNLKNIKNIFERFLLNRMGFDGRLNRSQFLGCCIAISIGYMIAGVTLNVHKHYFVAFIMFILLFYASAVATTRRANDFSKNRWIYTGTLVLYSFIYLPIIVISHYEIVDIQRALILNMFLANKFYLFALVLVRIVASIQGLILLFRKGTGDSLMNFSENNKLKGKTCSQNNEIQDNNSLKLIKRFPLKKYRYLFFIAILFILCGLFVKKHIDHQFIIQNKNYENTIKRLQHELRLKEHDYDELELQMKENKKIYLFKMLENEKDPIKYNALKEYYNRLNFEAQ